MTGIDTNAHAIGSSHTPRARGFTLLEILIVLAIVGILAALALPGYAAHQRNAVAREGAISLLTYASLQERIRSVKGVYQGQAVLTSFRELPTRVAQAYEFSVVLDDLGRSYRMSLSPHDNLADYPEVTLDSVGRRSPATVWR